MKKQLQQTTQFLNNNKGYIALGATLMLASVDASAYTAPTTGAGFDFWDIVVNDFLKGPIGATIGVAGMAFGIGSMMLSNAKLAATSIIGGAALLKADTIAKSFGMTIDLLS